MTDLDHGVDAQLVTAATLSGMTLFDRSGDKLGVVKEVFIDRVSGQVEFILGASGGFLGVGEKFHPLPWSMLSYNHTPEGYVAHLDREALRHAPAYDREQLASSHYGWSEQVRRYFANLPRPLA